MITFKEYRKRRSEDKRQWIVLNAYYTKANVLTNEHRYLICKYLSYLRMDEFFSNKFIFKPISLIIKRMRNNLGAKLGLFIPNNTCDTGITIWHYGTIIVNANAVIGKNCQLHGNNCIGNKGETSKAAPIIGDNVDIGFGSVIIGDVRIGDNVKIGANSIVTKSFVEPGITIAGNPAKRIS